jgi:hypothetical protein
MPRRGGAGLPPLFETYYSRVRRTRSYSGAYKKEASKEGPGSARPIDHRNIPDIYFGKIITADSITGYKTVAQLADGDREQPGERKADD